MGLVSGLYQQWNSANYGKNRAATKKKKSERPFTAKVVCTPCPQKFPRCASCPARPQK